MGDIDGEGLVKAPATMGAKSLERKKEILKVQISRKTEACPFANPLLDFNVKTGDCIWLNGSSGAGKTLTALHIAGIQTMRGVNSQMEWSAHINPDERVGILFQGAVLIDSLTVEGNILLGLQSAVKVKGHMWAQAEAKRLGALVGLHWGRDRGKRPGELSGGMRRRAALAQLLAQGKKLIILDEPFVGLDPATAVSVARELVHVRQVYGTAFLLISHVKEYVELLRPDHTITLETAPPAPPPRHPLASWLGPSFWGRTALTVGDYLFLSLPLIFLAFAAAGLAVGMLFADVLGRTEVLDRIMGVFDSEFKGVQIPGQSEVASKLMLAMLRAKITQVINRYVPEVKEQLYAQGLAKLFALELGPLLTALLLAGRIGGAYSGTVGTLQATQQNHLLQNLGISPRMWTLGPAAIAAVIAAPILTLVGTTVALSAGGFVAQWYHLSGNEVYWDKVQTSLVDFDQGSFNWTVFPPIVLLYRSWGFIAIILLVSEILSRWRKNLQPRNVSFVITSSVVCSSLLIIIADWGFSQLLVRSSA